MNEMNRARPISGESCSPPPPQVNADYHNKSVKDYGATCGNGAKTRNIFRIGALPSHHFILKGEKSLQKAC